MSPQVGVNFLFDSPTDN